MRYIRTKDKIYGSEKWENHPTPSGKNVYYDINCNAPIIREDDVFGMADTIEELCDEFVVVGIFENQIGCCCDTFDEAKELKNYVELPQEQTIYGAIWTDKGLIYVAKLNDKGVLELL